jgi:hypothetical protein
MKVPVWAFAAALLPALALVTGCHSYQVDATVENRTGDAITLLEVDYPSASFGTDLLPAGAEYHYRFKIRGSGPMKVQYTESKTLKVQQITGPQVFEEQEGRMVIALLPGGKAEFHPQLSPRP